MIEIATMIRDPIIRGIYDNCWFIETRNKILIVRSLTSMCEILSSIVILADSTDTLCKKHIPRDLLRWIGLMKRLLSAEKFRLLLATILPYPTLIGNLPIGSIGVKIAVLDRSSIGKKKHLKNKLKLTNTH